MITEPAPAKINLALHIRRKRPDGYHDLETLFAFARDGDVVTLAPGNEDSFTITGPFANSLNSSPERGGGPRPQGLVEGLQSQSTNLVLRARNAFRATFGCPPVAITLEKNLPIASGIGGGSADAGATLRALAHLTGLDPSAAPLVAIAAKLGADVPACLLGRTAFATGRGDDLTPLPPLGDLPLLLINPGVPLSTAAMFAAWDGIDRGGIATAGSTLERARAGCNDFTVPATAHAPVVAALLRRLEETDGCIFSRLSGSGATCFGIFRDVQSRDAAAAQAGAQGWWVLPTAAA